MTLVPVTMLTNDHNNIVLEVPSGNFNKMCNFQVPNCNKLLEGNPIPPIVDNF